MPFEYHCRPGYGSHELLIEFPTGVEHPDFYPALFNALASLQPTLLQLAGLWIQEDTTREMDSLQGRFDIHQDIWDMVFIMANDNQRVILTIDELLQQDGRFKKVAVDFSLYTLPPQDPGNPQ